MTPTRLALTTLFAACLTTAAWAEEQEWVLRVKQEAKSLAITLNGHSSYGSGANRVQGSGHVVERARAVSPFSRVRVDGPVDVQLVQGGAEAVRVVADDNIEPLVSTSFEGDTLVVGIKPGAGFKTRNAVKVVVDFRQLAALSLKGSGDARLDRFKGERLQLELSGSGDASIGLLEVRELQARLSGSGDVQAAGQADQQDWDLSGSGDVSAGSLSGRQVRARLSGSGDASLGVAQELDATLSGSGDLRYAGRPKLRSQVTGSGELMAR
jgi:hypothetical protein